MKRHLSCAMGVAALVVSSHAYSADASAGPPPGETPSVADESVSHPDESLSHADESTSTARVHQRVAEHVRVGAFGGLGFPRPLSVEGMVVFEHAIGLGVEYGTLPSVTVLSGVDTRMHAVAGDVRIFLTKNTPFFVGLAAGRQHLTMSAKVATIGTMELDSDTWFINPRIGVLATTSWGLAIGCDIGAQIPLSTTSSSSVPASIPIPDAITGAANFLGKGVVPTVNLLRLGLVI